MEKQKPIHCGCVCGEEEAKEDERDVITFTASASNFWTGGRSEEHVDSNERLMHPTR